MNKNRSCGDMWRTPPEVVDYIQLRFGTIKLDLCASDNGHVCSEYVTEQDDFLLEANLDAEISESTYNLFLGGLCWMNPPYSNPLPFVKQAIKWSQAGYAVSGILNNDPSTKWYVELAENAAIIMPIIGGRIAFLGDDGRPINGNNKPQLMFYLAPFGSKTKTVGHVHIGEIYPNGKPSRRKDAK